MISSSGQFSDPQHELWRLLDALCEDRITQEQMQTLEEWVLSDATARRIYRDYIELHGSLYWDTAAAEDSAPAALPSPEEASSPKAASLAPNPTSRRPMQDAARKLMTKRSLLVLAVLLLAGLSFWLGQGLQPQADNPGLANRDQHDSPETDGPEQDAVAGKSSQDRHSPGTNPRQRSNAGEDPWPAIAQRAPRPGNSDQQPDKTAQQNPAVASHDSDDEPLPEQVRSSQTRIVSAINREIRQGWEDAEVEPSPLAGDAEWIRRVHLDLAGHIPPAETVAEFLKDRRKNKRERILDELLEDPAYVRHFATVWTNLLVGRSTERDVERFAVHRYLRESFGRNRPWNEVVSDFIAAEGPAEENGASGFLLAHLNNEAVPATAITARLFLCTQVQCTQCHKHPANDADQSEFWELNSFFKQTAIERRQVRQRNGPSKIQRVLVSQPRGGPTFYEDLHGVMQTAYPEFAGVRIDADPEVNRRRELAELMTRGESPQMARAMVNRLWAHFFGYGFTRPLDDMGPHNPPSHPELLERLSREFVQSGYDVKQLIRWICLSDAYQRSSRFSAGNERDNPDAGEAPLFSRMYVRAMTAEQLYDSLLMASKAHLATGSSWEEVQRQRQKWLQQFVTAFETEENDEETLFEGTVPQALLLMNSDLVAQAVRPKQGTFFSEVVRSPGSEAEKIRRLCLAALSRYPTPQELAAARRLIKSRRAAAGNNPQAAVEALQDIFWAYLNSNEFILVH